MTSEQDRIKAQEEFAKRHPWAASMAFEGPWTEADEIFVECLTGEYDWRVQRKSDEQAARDPDL